MATTKEDQETINSITSETIMEMSDNFTLLDRGELIPLTKTERVTEFLKGLFETPLSYFGFHREPINRRYTKDGERFKANWDEINVGDTVKVRRPGV